MKKLILLSIILISLTTCKKTLYKSTVSGQVLDKQTQQPIENVSVFLVGSQAGTSGTPSFTEIEKIKTTSDGKFSFSFNRSEYQRYYLYAKPSESYKYFSTGSYNDYKEISFSKKFMKESVTKNMELLHCGYLKVNFNHTSSDTITFIGAAYFPDMTPYNQTMFTTYGTEFKSYTPPYIDNRTYVFLMRGNANNKVGFSVSKKGADGTEEFFFSRNYTFYATSHDTTFYQFNY